jgi:hypothetical protein
MAQKESREYALPKSVGAIEQKKKFQNEVKTQEIMKLIIS